MRFSKAAMCVVAAAMVSSSVAVAQQKRALPDYDGRDAPPASASESLLWVPRVLLFPLYVVSEFAVRRPLGWLIGWAERAHVPEILLNTFTFGADHRAGVVPMLLLQSGFQPSAGVYAFWNDAFLVGHDLRLRADFSSNDYLTVAFSDRYDVLGHGHTKFRVEGTFTRRPDLLYFGIGSFTRQDDAARYGAEAFEARTSSELRPWRLSSVRGLLALRTVGFRPGARSDVASLDDRIEAGDVPSPPGYDTGYTAFGSALQAALDSRQERPRPGTGVRATFQARHDTDVELRNSWLTWGGSLTGFWDVNELQRVLSAGVAAGFSDPIADSTLPFTEYIRLGGDLAMLGFFPGRLRDRSAIVADVSYHWPVWIWLDGVMRFEVGNVFGAHLESFDAGTLRYSASIGLESTGSRDSPFHMVVGIGSRPFSEGGDIDSVRLAIGTRHGF